MGTHPIQVTTEENRYSFAMLKPVELKIEQSYEGQPVSAPGDGPVEVECLTGDGVRSLSQPETIRLVSLGATAFAFLRPRATNRFRLLKWKSRGEPRPPTEST